MQNKALKGKKARNTGLLSETKAVWFLRLKGYRIVQRNFKPPQKTGAGEIDIIAVKDGVLTFIEVKYRANMEQAVYAVTKNVQLRRIKGAEFFIATHPEYTDYPMRFDAVLMTEGLWPEIIENAWEVESF